MMSMWSEKVATGYKFVERYRDPLTGKDRRVSVTMEKDTRQTRKIAQGALDAKIQEALSNSKPPRRGYRIASDQEVSRRAKSHAKGIHMPA